MNRYKLFELVEKIKADEFIMELLFENDEGCLLWNLINCDPDVYEECLVVYGLIQKGNKLC